MIPLPSPGRIIVLGDILVDMVSRTDGNIMLGVDTFARIHTSQGGSAANVAARLGVLGVDVVFVGKVGADPFGAFLESRMHRAGVEVRLARDTTLATGKVFVMVDGNGERTMITDRGASETLSSNDLPEDVFTPGCHLHLTGYMFSEGARRGCAIRASELAVDTGMSVSVDPSSSPLLRDIGVSEFLDWTSGAHLCFPNLPEGRVLTGKHEPREIVSRLLEIYPAVVLKLGSGGAIYADEEGRTFELPAKTTAARDTTGAGDALCAGFLAGLVAGKPPDKSLEQGMELAGKVVGVYGSAP